MSESDIETEELVESGESESEAPEVALMKKLLSLSPSR